MLPSLLGAKKCFSHQKTTINSSGQMGRRWAAMGIELSMKYIA
jgi:hypothetical protein